MKVTGTDLEQLAFGDVLEAYGTELFGDSVTRSKAGDALVRELALLNLKALGGRLTASDRARRRELRGMFPSYAGTLPS